MRGFKYLFLTGLLIVGANTLMAQVVKIDSNYTNSHYLERMEFFNAMPHQRHEIVFLGNSITEHGEWQELVPGKPVLNRGIGGDNTFGVLARVGEIAAAHPDKIFVMIGINDLFRKLPYEVTINNYQRIIQKIKQASPQTKLYIQSILPINEDMTKEPYTKGRNMLVPELNRRIKALALEQGLVYVDLHPLFEDAEGKLKRELAIDGIHLKASAYITWVMYLKSKNYL